MLKKTIKIIGKTTIVIYSVGVVIALLTIFFIVKNNEVKYLNEHIILKKDIEILKEEIEELKKD